VLAHRGRSRVRAPAYDRPRDRLVLSIRVRQVGSEHRDAVERGIDPRAEIRQQMYEARRSRELGEEQVQARIETSEVRGIG